MHSSIAQLPNLMIQQDTLNGAAMQGPQKAGALKLADLLHWSSVDVKTGMLFPIHPETHSQLLSLVYNQGKVVKKNTILSEG